MLLREISSLPIGFGGGAISGEGGGYGFGEISVSASIDLLHYAFSKGIKIFDTAPIYGYGSSEERMGLAFKDWREKVFIVSKAGVDWHDNGRVNMSNRPKIVRKMLEHSLRRLQSDYLDLYMIHWPDASIDIRMPLEVLAKAQLEGKIKHVGLCNTDIDDLQKGKEICTIEVVQSEFNLFNQKSATLFEYLAENKISFMSWGTFDKGIITGRVDEKRHFDRCDARSWAPWWKKSNYQEKIKKMQEIFPVIESRGYMGLELALGFNLSFSAIEMLLCGARSHEQVDSIIKALSHLPDQQLLDDIKKIIDE